MGGIGLRPDQVNNIVNTLFVANRKNPRSDTRQDSLKTTDGVEKRIHDDFVTSRELKALLNDPNRRVALSLSDPYHPGTATQLADTVTDELDRSDGKADGWIRVEDRTWASQLLREFTGSKRDGYISREGLQWALESGKLVVGEGGRMMSADEAQDRGNTVITIHENKDGPTLAMYQANNRYRVQPHQPGPVPPPIDRPAPPPINDRPSPPPINDRPLPPPIDPRPVPPPINPYPAPPPIAPPSYRSPARILGEFQAAHADLKRTYNSTPMNPTTFARLERELIDFAVSDLVRARSYPFAERKQVLGQIYNGSAMTPAENTQIEQRLVADELDRIMMDTRHLSFQERKAQLGALYNGSSMTPAQNTAAEKQLINQEVDRIGAMYGTSLMEKLRILGALYNSSSMSSSEHQAAQQRIERAHYAR